MYNYLFLKEKLILYSEKKKFEFEVLSLNNEGLIISIKNENFEYIKEFLNKYKVYEVKVLNEQTNIMKLEFKMKERFRKHKL